MGGIFTVCWNLVLLSKALLTCYFTDDYSENKPGSEASRAWDLHGAEATSRINVAILRIKKRRATVQDAFHLPPSIYSSSDSSQGKSGQRDGGDDAERLKNISSLHEIHLIHLVQCLYYIS